MLIVLDFFGQMFDMILRVLLYEHYGRSTSQTATLSPFPGSSEQSCDVFKNVAKNIRCHILVPKEDVSKG
jgi:hypothetical protein